MLLREDGVLLIGEPAERRSLMEPARFASEFKRRIGDPTPVLLGGSPFPARGLMAHLLRGVVKVVSDREGGPPDHTDLPGQLGRVQARAVRPGRRPSRHRAGERGGGAGGGRRPLRLHQAGEMVAVYDLGGGTFDAAVLRDTGEGFELVGDPRGIEQMGGVYFDDAVFSWVVGHLGPAFTRLDPDDPSTPRCRGCGASASRPRRPCRGTPTRPSRSPCPPSGPRSA